MTPALDESVRLAADALVRAGAKEAYLFGSTSHEGHLDPTDIDLAVSGISPERFFAAMAAAAALLDRPLDLVDLDEDSPLVRYLRNKGRLKRVA